MLFISLPPLLKRLLPLLAACGALLLGGCAAPGQDTQSILAAPTEISELYSQFSLHAQMALTREDERTCSPDECERRAAFDKRVSMLGAKLAAAAYKADPALKERIPRFNFAVLDKTEPGTASTAGGNVVVLRPVSEMVWSDEALSFVIAREMGHVIARHHEFNTGASIAVTVIVGVLAPVVGVAKLLAVASSSPAATGFTNIASFAGSRAVIASYWPSQRQSADVHALKLLTDAQMDYGRVSAGFASECLRMESTRWTRELDDSRELVAALHNYPPVPTAEERRAFAAETATLAVPTAAADSTELAAALAQTTTPAGSP